MINIELKKRAYVIVIPARNKPYLRECDDDNSLKLETLQNIVKDHIEIARVNDIAIICGECAKIRHEHINPFATLYYNNMQDFIAGDAVVMKINDCELVGFTYLNAIKLLADIESGCFYE